MREVAERLESARDRLQRMPSRRGQRVLLGIATSVFIVGGLWAVWSLNIGLGDIRWGPIVLSAVLGVPLTAVANTWEYSLSGRILEHRIKFGDAWRVTMVSTAANLLPIPGAVMVRVQALRQIGSAYGGAASSTAIVGLAWIAVSALLAAGWLLAAGELGLSSIFAVAGVATGALGYALLHRAVRPSGRRAALLSALIGIEIFGVSANALRLILLFYGLGIDATFSQAFVLSVSSSLSSAAGILPGGFGLREVIAALLAPVVGLPPSAGFVIVALNRVVGVIAHAPLTIPVLISPAPDAEGDVPPEDYPLGGP